MNDVRYCAAERHLMETIKLIAEQADNLFLMNLKKEI